jgi:hypothetical protein
MGHQNHQSVTHCKQRNKTITMPGGSERKDYSNPNEDLKCKTCLGITVYNAERAKRNLAPVCIGISDIKLQSKGMSEEKIAIELNKIAYRYDKMNNKRKQSNIFDNVNGNGNANTVVRNHSVVFGLATWTGWMEKNGVPPTALNGKGLKVELEVETEDDDEVDDITTTTTNTTRASTSNRTPKLQESSLFTPKSISKSIVKDSSNNNNNNNKNKVEDEDEDEVTKGHLSGHDEKGLGVPPTPAHTHAPPHTPVFRANSDSDTKVDIKKEEKGFGSDLIDIALTPLKMQQKFVLDNSYKNLNLKKMIEGK